MALIQVTSRDLKNAADTLRTLNSSFNSQVENLAALEQKLNGQWDGQANDAFHMAFNNDKIKWDMFHTQIDQYALALDNIAIEYENKENANLSIASTRTAG